MVLLVAVMTGAYYLQPSNASNSGQLGPWKTTTSYPINAQGFSCAVNRGYAYCVGGYNGSETKESFFAPLSEFGVGAWARTTDYPMEVQDERCVASSDYIYCIGGYVNSPNSHNIAVSYFASLSSSGIGQWASTTAFPYPAPDLRCTTDLGYVYCVSAHYNGTAFTEGGDSYFAQLSANGIGKWTPSSQMPTMTAGCSGAGDYIYCFGGGPCYPPGDCSSPSYYASLSSNGVGAFRRTSDLPTAVWANYLAAGSYVYYMSIPIYYAAVSQDGIGSWATTTNYPNSTYPGECFASYSDIYCIGGTTFAGQSTNDVSYAVIGAPNPSALQLRNPPPFPNAEYLAPAWSGSGGCSVSVNGVFAGAPCFDHNIDDAFVFNCATAAATPSGCTASVVSPSNTAYNYELTIWYPSYNSSLTDVNCKFLPGLGYSSPLYGWCISTGSSSFIISQSAMLGAP